MSKRENIQRLLGVSYPFDAKSPSTEIMPSMLNLHNIFLQDVDDKLREVNLNFANVEEKIYQMLKEALMQLQNETKTKVRS